MGTVLVLAVGAVGGLLAGDDIGDGLRMVGGGDAPEPGCREREELDTGRQNVDGGETGIEPVVAYPRDHRQDGHMPLRVACGEDDDLEAQRDKSGPPLALESKSYTSVRINRFARLRPVRDGTETTIENS